jgi:putative tryptophan/tyrosine transport system substrate-binding protein
MKKLGWLIISVIVLITAVLYMKRSNNEQNLLVAAVFPVTVDAFVQFQNRARETLGQKGIEFIVFSAEGDPTRFHSILDLAIKRKPNVLIMVGTQLTNIGLGSRYSNYKGAVIASCISDPEKVEALKKIGIDPPRNRNVAILTDMPRVDAYNQSATAITTAIPDISKVGILYNKSEINSYNTANKLAEPLRQSEITILDGVVSSENDVVRVASTLIRNGAQLIVIPHDKYVIKQAIVLSKMGRESSPKVPVFALDDGTVRKDGAAFGVSVDYGLIGELTAKNAIGILAGTINAKDANLIQQNQASLIINTKVWQALGMPRLDSEKIRSLKPTLTE